MGLDLGVERPVFVRSITHESVEKISAASSIRAPINIDATCEQPLLSTNFFSISYLDEESKVDTFSFSSPGKAEDLDGIARIQASLPFQKDSKTSRICKTTLTLTRSSISECVFQFDIRWRSCQTFDHIQTDNKVLNLIRLITPEYNSSTASAWSPRDFYESVHIPDKNDKTYESLQVPEMQSTLFAYQKRSVQWMLQREGVDTYGKELVKDLQSAAIPHGWISSRTVDGEHIFVNQWLGLVTSNERMPESSSTEVSGGILAEEMGLGKTVEIIALLTRNKRVLTEQQPETGFGLRAVGATIIVCPDSIVNQWLSEINLHAPSMRTLLYPGITKGKPEMAKQLVDQVARSDVVLCSYNTLAREVHFARAASGRTTRLAQEHKRERLTSPLVKIHWWRCILDECQMIQSGVSNAAEVAGRLPRQHAWAVSGTPLRKDPGDVYGFLRFLQLEPFSWSVKTWTRLLDQYPDIFKGLIKQTTLRHTKHLVKDELELPLQKRIISVVLLTQIEEQHYSNTFDQMCQKIGLNRDGSPLNEDWNPDDPAVIEQMRSSLTRLRQLCLHPDVGAKNTRALGGRAQDILRTAEDVLRVMIEQNEAALRTDERTWLINRLRWGQVLEADKMIRYAFPVWRDVLVKSQQTVICLRLAVKKALSEAKEKEDDSTPEKIAQTNRLNQLRNRLRLTLELEHMAQFFIGNAYFQIKINTRITAPDSDEFLRLEKLEMEQYDKARAIRIEMLLEPKTTAQKLIAALDNESHWDLKSRRAAEQGFPEVEEAGGMESCKVFDDLDRVAYHYNKLISQVLEWRDELVKLLSRPLVDDAADVVDDSTQGDEYEKSTLEQDEAYARMDVFRAAVTDLSELLTGHQNALVKTDVDTWQKLADSGKGHAPDLMKKLLETRRFLISHRYTGSIRGALARLKSIKYNLHRVKGRDTRQNLEEIIIDRVEGHFRESLSHQQTIMENLSRDVSSFINVVNARLGFYRQLQHISDLVAPWTELEKNESPLGILNAEAKLDKEEAQLLSSIKKKASQARYLEHLQQASSSLESERRCIICQVDNYEIGVLTSCGHRFCQDCINAWLSNHSRCPQCRSAIRSRADLHQITYKPQELRIEQERIDEDSEYAVSGSSREGSPKITSIYSQISTQQLNAIKSIDLPHNHGTKINFVARHIIWLRTSDPGAKTIIFSQFRKFCPDYLSQAFDRLGIRYAVVGNKVGVERFKHDAEIECLLMHAGSQASGMNLVNASHVLLCEPLVNTALELQAIARVHRIGQQRPTTVWMYLVEGTVEKAIYDLGLKRRHELMGEQENDTRNEADIQAADAEDMTDKPLNTLLSKCEEGGEIVGKDDLWQCLFGDNRFKPRSIAEFPMGDRGAIEGEEEDQ